MVASIVMRHKSFTYKVGGSISHDNQVNIMYRRRMDGQSSVDVVWCVASAAEML